MNRLILRALLTLALLSVGLFWLQGRAQTEEGAPPPIPAEEAEPVDEGLPLAVDTNAVGLAPPEATELTREQRRFYRYDRNRGQKITRNEMISTRSNAFR